MIMGHLMLHTDFDDYASAALYDLGSGKPRRRVFKSSATTSSRHAIPPLIRESLSVLDSGGFPFCRPSLDRHIRALEFNYRASLSLPVGDSRRLRAEGRFRNDKALYRQIAIHRDPPLDGEQRIFKSRLPYALRSSGRVYGGVQSCSRDMKAALFAGLIVDGIEVRNYDLKSSQINALIMEFERAGMSTQIWLDLLRNKDSYADEVMGSEDLFKTALFAVIFGASTAPNHRAPSGASAVLDEIRQYVEENVEDEAKRESEIEKLNSGFNRFIKPYKRSLDAYREYLVNDLFRERARRTPAKGWFVENACQMKFYYDEHSNRERAKKLAALILQGWEACYIHHLTTLGEKYGYKVLANEHDGVVCLGEIPQAAQDEARELSGFDRAELVEKPFAKVEPSVLREAA